MSNPTGGHMYAKVDMMLVQEKKSKGLGFCLFFVFQKVDVCKYIEKGVKYSKIEKKKMFFSTFEIVIVVKPTSQM